MAALETALLEQVGLHWNPPDRAGRRWQGRGTWHHLLFPALVLLLGVCSGLFSQSHFLCSERQEIFLWHAEVYNARCLRLCTQGLFHLILFDVICCPSDMFIEHFLFSWPVLGTEDSITNKTDRYLGSHGVVLKRVVQSWPWNTFRLE